MKDTRIRILPELISNRIAAGEIIERPASVVRELLDNAIDAGARRIEVEIRGGGLSYISLKDDGCGIDPASLLLAFERHATSKIQSLEDLDRIETLGFRGEALPSIASVASVTMESFRPGSESGSRIHLERGKMKHFENCAISPGTRITVRDLFQHVPARRKFLKSVKTELAHIHETFIDHALVYPDIHFILTVESSMVYNAASVDKWHARITQLFSEDFLSDMIPVMDSREDAMLEGFISDPQHLFATARSQRLYCNGRRIRDRIVTQAVYRSYQEYLSSRQHPAFILKLTIPPEEVDINVHPAKSEVRFRNTQSVFEHVWRAVGAVVGSSLAHQFPASIDAGTIREDPHSPHNLPVFIPPSTPEDSRTPIQSAPVSFIPSHDVKLFPEEPSGVDETGSFRIVGQFLKLFILAETRRELLIIDQHTAHERILFEQFKDMYLSGSVPSQMLMFPVPVEVSAQEFQIVLEFQDFFKKMGIVAEEFGARSFLVRALPKHLSEENPSVIMKTVAAELQEVGHSDRYQAAERAMLITLACRRAIKAGDELTTEQMMMLVKDLYRLNLPASCPHGRPIIIRMDAGEIERRFKRG